MTTEIKHLLVLMLENNSFDHVLGYVEPFGTLVQRPMVNEYDEHCYKSQPQVELSGSTPTPPGDPDPPHNTDDALYQIYGTKTPGLDAVPQGRWFVDSFMGSNTTGGQGPQWPLTAYATGQLPCLHALAQDFTVMTRWFSSVPGPTGPNRLFAMCGTSGGYCGAAWSFAGTPVPLPSIFGALPSTQDWKIYWDGGYEPNGNNGRVYTWRALADVQAQLQQTTPVANLLTDIANGTLPKFAWISPSASTNGKLPGADFAPTSMHPGNGSPLAGDAMAGLIYNALLQSPAWSDTALLIVFDEHGGMPDSHLPTATVAAPADPWSLKAKQGEKWWGTQPDNPVDFGFESLGIRVPAILVSPRVAAASDSTHYEHASIPAALRNNFGMSGAGPDGALTARDAAAQDFLTNNVGANVRDDCQPVQPYVPPG
ncbi:MAG: hypothetical protein NXI35_38285 [bacterium]|nr:hypothetical protein [bacterium]